MMNRAVEFLEPMFIEQVLPKSGHGLLATQERWEAFIEDIPETAMMVREKLLERWNKSPSTPEEKWHQFKEHLNAFVESNSKKGTSKSPKTLTFKEKSRLVNYPAEVIFRHGYPRLDANVSKTTNHLLKSPFCVHPKTGRVCVPIHQSEMETFDPLTVPTLPQLMDELDQYVKTEGESKKDTPEWKKTSLNNYFGPFEKEFLAPMVAEQRRNERDAAEQKAAITGDF